MASVRAMRWLGLWLVVVFVGVQSAAFVHAAEHGFHAHKHEGKSCEVQDYCEHLVLSDSPQAEFLLPQVVAVFMPVPVLVGVVARQVPGFGYPRAPPFLV